MAVTGGQRAWEQAPWRVPAFTKGRWGSHAGRLTQPRAPASGRERLSTSDSAGLSPRLLYSLRAEEEHEKYSPRQGEEARASQCYRCCDPGAPVYPAVPVPQINITILKGQGAAGRVEGPLPRAGLPRPGRVERARTAALGCGAEADCPHRGRKRKFHFWGSWPFSKKGAWTSPTRVPTTGLWGLCLEAWCRPAPSHLHTARPRPQQITLLGR